MGVSGVGVVRLFGFTQDPNNLDYMIVMDYAKDGSLRDILKIFLINGMLYSIS